MPQPMSPTQIAPLIDDLRVLIDTTTVESRAADEAFAAATSTMDAERDHAMQESDELHAHALGEERQRHADAMKMIEQRASDNLTHANAQYEHRSGEIDDEAERSRNAAQKSLKEQEWLAESVFEAAGQQPSKRLRLTCDELDRNDQRIDALLEVVDVFRTRCRMATAASPEPADCPELDPDPETALEALRDQVDACHDDSDTLHRLILPRLFIGPLPIVITCIDGLLGWAATIGVLTLLHGGPIEDHVAPGLWGGFALLLLSLILLWPLRTLANRQFHRQDTRLMTRIAATRAMRDEIRRMGEEQCRVQEEQHRSTRDDEIRSARQNIAPHLEKVDPRKVRRHEKLKANFTELTDRIHATRQDATQAELEQHDRTLAEIEQRHDAEHTAIRESWNERVAESRSEHAAIIERLSESWTRGTAAFKASFDSITGLCSTCRPLWSDAAWTTFEPNHAFNGLIKCGEWSVDMQTLAASGLPDAQRFPWSLPSKLDIPTLLHLPRAGSLYLEFAEHGRDESVQTLQSTMLSLLASLPPGKVRFTVIDPVGLGQSFAGFMHLADHEDAHILEKVWTEPRHIEQQLTDLTEHMENVIQTYLRNEYETIDEYNLAAGEIAEPYRYLVIADLPVNLSETAGKRLTSIMQAGARCGVYTLIACDTRQSMPRDIMRDDLIEHSLLLEMTETGWRSPDPALSELPLHLESPPDEARLTHIVRAAGAAAEQAQRVEVPFSTITPKPEQRWQESTAKELRVALGQTGATRRQQLALGRGTSQHALVAGKTGSGKSTLLHVLITNLALWYSPDEIEFYLVDFKKGVEFQTYAEHGLPHARVIAIESDREFGLSVLQRIDQDLKERGERFRELGVQDLASYREKSGEPPPHPAGRRRVPGTLRRR